MNFGRLIGGAGIQCSTVIAISQFLQNKNRFGVDRIGARAIRHPQPACKAQFQPFLGDRRIAAIRFANLDADITVDQAPARNVGWRSEIGRRARHRGSRKPTGVEIYR